MAKRATAPTRKHLTLSGKPVGAKRVGEFRASVDKIVALLTEKRLTVTQVGDHRLREARSANESGCSRQSACDPR